MATLLIDVRPNPTMQIALTARELKQKLRRRLRLLRPDAIVREPVATD